jgi:3-oxoacyl-[acyl-carrier-protein] synthase-1
VNPPSPVSRQVAVTGIGIVSCLGNSPDEVQAALREGRSGIVLDGERKSVGFRSGLTGRIRDFDPSDYGLTKRQRRHMAEPALYGYAAASDAVADAGLGPDDLASGRTGVVFGNDSCIAPSAEVVEIVRREKGTHFIGGGHIFKTMNSTASMNLATLLGVRGASWTLSAACASGAHAVGQGLMLIRAGLQDCVIVGASQELNWPAMASFDSLGAFSRREEAPEEASRPFDRRRDGLVPSGGAACLVLEGLDRALARRARVRATVRGYGFSSDGKHLTVPSGEGARRTLRLALADAGIGPDDVDYVNAHATSTERGDAVEGQAIADVLGTEVPVSSTKSMTGHECWMSGASELVYCILMAEGGFMAPNRNYGEADPDCGGINVVRSTLERDIRTCLSNSFGFGGTNACLVLAFNGTAEKGK